jgi:hypothetical protein
MVLILVALPLAGRWLYFYAGRYRPGTVPRPDLSSIQARVPEIKPFTDQVVAAEPGVILVDQAHSNRFDLAELNVLHARLAARGQRLEPVEAAEDWPARLKQAKAVIIVSPGEDWTQAESQQIQDFVDKGGRLLLVTDPTRYQAVLDETGSLVGYDQDVSHLNPLASRFGLVFQADYLYNTIDNEGNFRNIKLTEFASHELTQGLAQVVFYATHSILSEQPALIAAGGETRSSSSERAGTLTVAALAAGGAVLAVGDLTFMTEPYDAAYDNDLFVSHIADFLTGAPRQYDLADFPLFFGDQVDLVFAGQPLLDSDFLSSSSALQALFVQEGKALTVRQAEDKQQDTLFLGLYGDAGEAEPYLQAAQVTLQITPTQAIEDPNSNSLPSLPVPSPAPAASLTTTLAVTSPVGTLGPGTGRPTPEIEATAEVSPSIGNHLEIGSVGSVLADGTSLLLLQSTSERQVMVVLAGKKAGLQDAVQRLEKANLEGCLLRETETPTRTALALCPTGEIAPGQGTGGWQGSKPEVVPSTATPPAPPESQPVTDTIGPPALLGETGGSILIISLDKGQGHYDSLTGGDDFAAILESGYDVKVWSVARDGLPSPAELANWDLIVWAAGDYENAFGETESGLVLTLALQGVPIILSGAYLGDAEVTAVQRDVQVTDASHPITKGFSPDEIIPFVAPPSGSEYQVSVMDGPAEGEGSVLFSRGPNSDKAGIPSLFVSEGGLGDTKVVFMGFPLYLLPEEARTRLVLNMVAWMLAP